MGWERQLQAWRYHRRDRRSPWEGLLGLHEATRRAGRGDVCTDRGQRCEHVTDQEPVPALRGGVPQRTRSRLRIRLLLRRRVAVRVGERQAWDPDLSLAV